MTSAIAAIRLFESIASDVADLVLEFGGALSGEHGDGLVRSPFMRKMYGPALYDAAVNWAELVELRERIDEIKNDREMFGELHSLTVRKQTASKQHRAYLQSFGLTPVDRARVSAIDKGEEEDNPWERFVRGDDDEPLA